MDQRIRDWAVGRIAAYAATRTNGANLPPGADRSIPSLHDGTPNTLLEGIACGCFPVAGDLESIREWITPNENGLLFNSNSPQSIAEAIVIAIENTDLRKKAARLNQEIIASRAEYKHNMERVENFYRQIKGG